MIIINFLSVNNETGHTSYLSTREKYTALNIVRENQDLYIREIDTPPKGKIEMRTRNFFFCSNWNEDRLIIDAIKVVE